MPAIGHPTVLRILAERSSDREIRRKTTAGQFAMWLFVTAETHAAGYACHPKTAATEGRGYDADVRNR